MSLYAVIPVSGALTLKRLNSNLVNGLFMIVSAKQQKKLHPILPEYIVSTELVAASSLHVKTESNASESVFNETTFCYCVLLGHQLTFWPRGFRQGVDAPTQLTR